jgi:ATP-dependent RNA helicase DeaD
VTISVTPKQLTVDAIEQAYLEVPAREKAEKLIELLKAEEPEQAIIFCRTKIGAARLDKALSQRGLDVKALHGDMSQGSRDGVMIAFKEHRVRLLVATDIAARGLDIEHVTHVINYDVPDTTDSYVHRIGRTGRVGRTGRAITLVTPTQSKEIPRIEREAKVSIGAWEPPEERLEHAPRPRRRDRDRDRKREPKAEPAGGENGTAPGSVKLFVNRGRRSGVSEEDLRWALREGAVVPEESIDSIRVLERFSFVEVSEDVAEQTVERLDGTKLKGRALRLEIARS